MAVLVERIQEFYKRKGLWETVRRGYVELRRMLYLNKVVVMGWDVRNFSEPFDPLPEGLTAEFKESEAELSEQDQATLTSNWNAKIKTRQIRERFEKRCLLWLLRKDGNIISWRWTIRGKPLETFMFPLLKDDVYIFDEEVLPDYRGKGYSTIHRQAVIQELRKMGVQRAFAEIHAWNRSALRSAEKEAKRIGEARRFKVLGKIIVIWSMMKDFYNIKADRKASVVLERGKQSPSPIMEREPGE